MQTLPWFWGLSQSGTLPISSCFTLSFADCTPSTLAGCLLPTAHPAHSHCGVCLCCFSLEWFSTTPSHSPEVLLQGWFYPLEVFGNTWRHFLLSWVGDGVATGILVGRGLGIGQPPQQRLTQSNVSAMLGLSSWRNCCFFSTFKCQLRCHFSSNGALPHRFLQSNLTPSHYFVFFPL